MHLTTHLLLSLPCGLYFCSLVNIDVDIFCSFILPTSLFVFFFLLLLGFPVELAGEKEKDKARDQDPGEPARRDQYYSTSGHSERPSGRISKLF